MAKGGRKASGILALIGGAIALLVGIIIIIPGIIPTGWKVYIEWEIAILIFSSLNLVGGILFIIDKKAGGILTIIGGSGGIVSSLPFMAEMYLNGVMFLFGICFTLALSGGIIGLIVGSES